MLLPGNGKGACSYRDREEPFSINLLSLGCPDPKRNEKCVLKRLSQSLGIQNTFKDENMITLLP